MLRYLYMYIITVIPIKKGAQKEYLSYFSSENIQAGSIVVIPVRSKQEDAIVVSSEEALDLKSEIKNRDYQLKKITKVKGDSPFNKDFFYACQIMKKYTVSNTGTIIKSLLPRIFIENISKLKKVPKKDNEEGISKHEKLIFQACFNDRLAFYRTLIREAFAKKESVFICVPTRYDIDIFNKELSRGIESYVFTLHSDMSAKILVDTYNKTIEKDHPVLILGTGIFLSVPRNDIKTIVIENESSDVYKQFSRPYVDIRSFAEILSFCQKTKLIFGDTLLRPETLYRHEQGEFGEISSPLYRLTQVENQTIVNMKEEERGEKKNTFRVISKEAREMIDHAFSLDKSVFLFTVRKGLAPMTVCNDCGNTLLCPSCLTPIVLYGPKQNQDDKGGAPSRIFMCNKCGRKEKTEVVCPKCSSWNLVPLGIGADKVYEEIKSLYPNTKIIQIDKETIKNSTEAKKQIDLFYKTEKCILIGTEMVFSYLEEKVYASAIVSLDGLFSIPNFNITQKIIHLIEKLKNITESKVVIQTRIPENKTLQYIINGNVLPVYREDLTDRKNFGYPPFKRLIKISFEGSSKETESLRNFLEHTLQNYDPQIFSAFVGKIKGNYITNTILKVNPKDWPLIETENSKIDPVLFENLSNLPLSFSLNVDPEDLL